MSELIDFPDANSSPLPGVLALPLLIYDRELIAELVAIDEAEREAFGLAALKIGVLALRQARGQVDADVVRREGERLLAGIEADLKGHALQINDRLTSILSEYFSPESGKFDERINRLVKRDGELEQVLRRQLGQDSDLTKTLAANLGPLMKILDPDASKGVLCSIKKTVEEQLGTQRERVLKEMQTRLDAVAKEFSMDHRGSGMSRLKALLDTTNRAINDNLSLDRDGSALALLRRELMEVLNRQERGNAEFQKELRATMAAIVTKRKEVERSPQHGLDFEDATWAALEAEAQAQGDVPERVGKTTGLIRACKVGDFVVCLGPDSAAEGEKIVIEAKERSFVLKKARKEIETARANRGCGSGLFVMSRKAATDGFPRLLRLGSDVFVVWDAEDPGDTILGAGLSVAKAVCFNTTKRRETAKAADFAAIDDAIKKIDACQKGLDDMARHTSTIRGSADKLSGQIGRMKESLVEQVEILNDRIGDLRAALGGTDEKAA